MLQSYLNLLTNFANGVLMPTLVALAFLYTVLNIFRLYIKEASKADLAGRKSAIAYGVGAVVVLVSFWGAVNWLTRTAGLNQNQIITPDYIRK